MKETETTRQEALEYATQEWVKDRFNIADCWLYIAHRRRHDGSDELEIGGEG